MWNSLGHLTNDLFRVTGHLDREHWIVVFGVALVVGIFMLKGFGTRI